MRTGGIDLAREKSTAQDAPGATIPASVNPQHVRETGPALGRSVSIETAGMLLGVSRRTVYNYIRDGKLQTIRTLGGFSQRVTIASIDSVVGSRWGRRPQ